MSQNTETSKTELCPRCYFAQAKIEGDIGICPKCGPIRKVHYEMKSIRQGKTLTGDYWKQVTHRAPKPKSKDPRACVRCGGDKQLERDHVKPRSQGGSDDEENLRDFCIGCHDYRHTRDGILKEIERRLAQIESGYGNQAQVTMWVFRLGILEYFNTPELVRQRGYKSYGAIAETHYSRWAEAIKALADWKNPYKAILVENQSKLNLYAEPK